MRLVTFITLGIVCLASMALGQTQDPFKPIAADGTAFTWAHNTSEFSPANQLEAPELNDGDSSDFIWLSHNPDGSMLPEPELNIWEAAGVIWDEPRSDIKNVIFTNGPFDGVEAADGAFSGQGSFHLQITLDGVSWQNSGITSQPAYTYYIDEENNGIEVSDASFAFTGDFPTVRGVRVLGLVHTVEDALSWVASCRQIEVEQEKSVQIVSQPEPQTLTIGDIATFSIQITGEPPLSYQWFLNDVAVMGADGPSYSTAPVEVADDGSRIHCLVADAFDSTISQSVVLTVNPSSGGDLTLASGGTAHYQIYHGPGESQVVVHAALELGQWLEEITNASFTVTTDETASQHLIVVGRNNPLVGALGGDFDFSAIEYDGFRLLTEDYVLFIAGSVDRGSMYGVYHFLDAVLGVRWFSPEFAVVPSIATLTVSPLDELQNPHFAYREIFSGDTDDGYFRQHNRLNGNKGGTHREFLDYDADIDDWSLDGASGGHNFQDIVGEVYHHGGQILTMNNGVRDQAAGYFIDRISTEGAGPWYAFSQEDNGWAADDDSQDFADAHGGALSAPILDMVIDIADQVRLVHPDAHLSTLAYQWSFDAPTGMTVPDYVMVQAAPIHADFGYPYNHPRNENIDFGQWNEIASSVGVWDYIANFQNYLQPLPNIKPMCRNIQYLSTLPSVMTYFGQGSYNTEGAEFADLRAWVAARLLWNPNLNYDDLIHEFCTGYYGSAGTIIVNYINQLHQSLLESGDRISSKQRITSDYLGLDFIMQADQLMAAADAAVGGDYAAHVHEVRLGVDMTILMREHMYEAEAEALGIVWTHDPSRRARFEQYATEAGITDYAEDSSIDELYAALDINRVNPDIPDIVPEGRQWIDFQDMDLSICCGANLVEDPLASDHGAVFKGSGPDWAIQMSMDLLPSTGEWTLYAYVRASLASGANPDGPAFFMGIWPGDHLEVPASDVQDGGYAVYQFPNMPISYETGRALWFAAGSEADSLFVDRIVAVRTFEVSGITDGLPHAFALERNYPNPFNPSTTIRFSLPTAGAVKLDIFDVRGRKVVSLIDRELLDAGPHFRVWEGQNLAGRRVASGVYYYRLVTDDNSATRAMVLIK